MASIISAGNATNGLAISSDNTGILQLKTGTGAGTTALTLDASQNATFAGTVTSSTGTLYPVVNGTAITISGSPSSIDFANVIPAWAKRVSISFSLVVLAASNELTIVLGTGATPTWVTSGYNSTATTTATALGNTTALAIQGATTTPNAAFGIVTLISQGNNIWTSAGNLGETGATRVNLSAGVASLPAALTSVRIIPRLATTFTSGTINLLWD